MAVAALPAEVSRRARVARSLSPAEWRRAAGLAFVIIALHVVGFGLLLGFVAPQHLRLGSGIFGIGVGITAYTLGMRHAFDADHIGAIDNTTRKLMGDGQRPLSVGFFFSLGHSSVVFLLAIGLSLGIRGLSGSVANDDSALHHATGLIGPTISGTFLFLIGILNLMVLIGIVRVFLRMRHGEFDEQQLEEHLNSRGFMNRFLGRATRAVKKPWQMYPLGLLFGLGFDTATEIALLATAGTAAAGGLPDLRDPLPTDPVRGGHDAARHDRRRVHELRLRLGVLQAGAQGLLQHHDHGAVGGRGPDRRQRGTARRLRRPLNLNGGIWDFVSNLDLNLVGYFIVALFVGTWIIAPRRLAIRAHRGALERATRAGSVS